MVLNAQLQHEVVVFSLQLGWLCRDNTFSIEWDARKEAPETTDMISLRFDEETREIVISLALASEPPILYGMELDVAGVPRWHVIFKWSKVWALHFESDGPHPAIIVALQTPPALQRIRPYLFDPDRENREPCSHFNTAHARIVHLASTVLRVQCQALTDLETFQKMAAIVSLPSPRPAIRASEERGVFSSSALKAYKSWVKRLDWPIAFQLEATLHNHLADPMELHALAGYITNLKATCGVPTTREILRSFRSRLASLNKDRRNQTSSTTVGACLARARQDVSPLHMALENHTRDDGFFFCYHVTVTPTRILPDGPFPDQSNRVLRRYPSHHDHFLRVKFTGEDLEEYRWDWGVSGTEFVRARVGGMLKSGFTIAGRKFEFLHFSQSALREHSVWFCSPFEDDDGHAVNGDSIRQSLGDFRLLERKPARLAARMSQAFSATEPVVTLSVDITQFAPNRDIGRDGSNFTDGLGEISPKVAEAICQSLASKVRNKRRFFITPSAYQFRLGGYKGMLVVDHTMEGLKIRLRKSQKKFDCPYSSELEIAQVFYKPKPAYLNRSLVMILETLGIPAGVFLALQDDARRDVIDATEKLQSLAQLLEQSGLGTAYRLSSVLLSLGKLGVGQDSMDAIKDDFMNRVIQFAVNHVLRVMKHGARIPLPGSYTFVGVADVHGYLEANEVFSEHGRGAADVSLTSRRALFYPVCIETRDETAYIEGKVLVTRSPMNHPGDVQFVQAIGRPSHKLPFGRELDRLRNCVVFSTKGNRSVPSMLSGGDLDGDEYMIIRDPSLFPVSCDPPAAYPPARVKEINRPCTINDIADWVVDYINSDIIGLVCYDLLVRADHQALLYPHQPQLCREAGCLQLAGLASAAVDFAKSGTPVDRRDRPRPLSNKKPDWSVGELGPIRSSMETYESQTAVGKLYRDIDLSFVDRLAIQQAKKEHRAKKLKAQSTAEERMTEITTAMKGVDISKGTTDTDPISAAVADLLRKYIAVPVDSELPPETVVVVKETFRVYVTELRCLCAASTMTRTPLTEEEVLVGTIASKTNQPRKRQSHNATLQERSEELVERIKLELSGERTRPAKDGSSDTTDLKAWLTRSWTAWCISLHDGERFGAKSFGFVSLGSIFDCVKELKDRM